MMQPECTVLNEVSHPGSRYDTRPADAWIRPPSAVR
jgi:hypothetical protein